MTDLRLLNLALRAATLGVKFAFILSLAIFLPPEQVGLYGLITVTILYSIYFVGLEFYTFSTRDLVARPRRDWTRLLSSQIVFSGVMYVVVLPVSSLLFWLEMLPWSVMGAFVVLVVLEHLSTELMRLLVAMENPLLATFILFIKQALWAVCFTFAMWLNPEFRNLSDLLFFWIAGTLVSILVGITPFWRLDWRGAFSAVDWVWVQRGLRVAIPLLVSSIAVRSMFTVDRYAFEALNGLALLGAYSVYMGVASAMLSFMESAVFVFYYPRMMKSYKNGDMSTFEIAYNNLTKQSLLWLTGLMVVATTSGMIIFPLLDQRIYADNISLFVATVFAMGVYIVGYVPQYGLYTTGKDSSILISNLTGLGVAGFVLAILSLQTTYWAVTISVAIGSAIATTMKCRKWMAWRRDLILSQANCPNL